MTDEDVLTAPELPLAWRRRAWTSPAMAAAGRLYANLRRRSRLPAGTGIRLSVANGSVADDTTSAYTPVGLSWWLPTASLRFFSPVEVYLSRRYSLHSNRSGAAFGSAAKRAPGAPASPAARRYGEFILPRLRLAAGALPQLASGVRLGRGGDAATASGGSDSRTGAPATSAGVAMPMPPLRLNPGPQARPVASTSVGHGIDMLDDMRAHPSESKPARRVQVATTAGPASLGDMLYDRAMEHLSIHSSVLRTSTADQGDHRQGQARVRNLPESAPASEPKKSGPVDVPALSREEVVHIADRVAQVLRQRERFVRERQGRL